ncbi:MAG: hypothetical protein Q8O52_12420 [Sulfuritalea sp.]|nr:hypothetical protein [Sulfuritalea sp.]
MSHEDCPELAALPSILDARKTDYVVRVPGSVYQPLLLRPSLESGISLSPGELEENEARFLRDLIRRLYPAENAPADGQPLRWQGKEIWLKRNIEKREESFRLRVDDSDWFYPDFIVWIVDHQTHTQTFGFVDPKGLTIGAGGGWSDYKIVSTLYMPHAVERQLAASGQKVEFEGEEWTFRVRGVLVSTSSFASLSTQAKFYLHDDEGKLAPPTEADFKRGRIVFQRPDTAYIDDVLQLLTEDTDVDQLLSLSALLFDNNAYFTPVGELEHDLALRHEENTQTESEFVAVLIRDYLGPDAKGHFGAWASKNRRRQLMDYAAEGKWGFGGEKVPDIRDHQAPCEELWKRKQKAGGC